MLLSKYVHIPYDDVDLILAKFGEIRNDCEGIAVDLKKKTKNKWYSGIQRDKQLLHKAEIIKIILEKL